MKERTCSTSRFCFTPRSTPQIAFALDEFYRQHLGPRHGEGEEPPSDGGPEDADSLVLVDGDGNRVLTIQENRETTPRPERTLCVIGTRLGDSLGRSLGTWLPVLRRDDVSTNR
jgi:hypothetical protein